MRRKSIGATSQAFHEPMSTGAFVEFLMRLGCRDAGLTQTLGARLKCWHQEGPRNALGHRPEPEVLPLPAETSREAPKCCAWQHQGRGPETRSGTVQSLKCCPCPSAAPGSIKGGGAPETRSGTVQSLKC